MSAKYPSWTRRRVGRGRVHWVAYDDRAGAEGRSIVAQGYAPGLAEADAEARAALAGAGLYGARRSSTASTAPGVGARAPGRGQGPPGPRQYLYSRRHDDRDGSSHARAHLVLRKTPRRIHVTEQSFWTGQLGTEDEAWAPPGRSLALDRARLERDGSVDSGRWRESSFYARREEAEDGPSPWGPAALGRLGLRAPCTREDIKAAYRRRAMEAHPDRGGDPAEFQAVEDAYRRLSRAAEGPNGEERPGG